MKIEKMQHDNKSKLSWKKNVFGWPGTNQDIPPVLDFKYFFIFYLSQSLYPIVEH